MLHSNGSTILIGQDRKTATSSFKEGLTAELFSVVLAFACGSQSQTPCREDCTLKSLADHSQTNQPPARSKTSVVNLVTNESLVARPDLAHILRPCCPKLSNSSGRSWIIVASLPPVPILQPKPSLSTTSCSGWVFHFDAACFVQSRQYEEWF